MPDDLLNPEVLAPTHRPQTRRKRGKLKIFFGMGRGVGKTNAMIEAAQRELDAGRNVIIGYVELRGAKEPGGRENGLPPIPLMNNLTRNPPVKDMDLDGVLARRPQLVVVDELAHSNGPLSRHPKRYQDVLELLDAGIDVFTTLNVHSVESCSQAVLQITGKPTRETVPDAALEGSEFELVDLPPKELRSRLAADEFYEREAARVEQQHIFRPGSLSALRELTLRFVADHAGEDALATRQVNRGGEPWKSSQRLLVGVSPAPDSAALVRWTRRSAGELHAHWMAVYVDLGRPLSKEAQGGIARNLALAREMGAELITTTDDDVAKGLLRIAREHQATQIVVGKPAQPRGLARLRRGSIVGRLIRDSGDIDVHAVRTDEPASPRRTHLRARFSATSAREYLLAVVMMGAITGLNALLFRWMDYRPLGLIYLVGVVVLGTLVRRGPTLAGAVLTALAWDYFFQPPRYSFVIDSFEDLMLAGTYLVVALLVGNLTARLHQKEASERRREQHATGLYLLTRALAQASHVGGLLAIVTEEVSKAFHAEVAVLLTDTSPDASIAPHVPSVWTLSDDEKDVAMWALEHRQPAGRGTGTMPSAEGVHLPLVAGDRGLGVLSLHFRDQEQVTPDQRDLLDAFVRQIALALDRERLRDAEQHAKLVAESERLSKTLLNSVSHEIRTPLAAIMSAASSLSEASNDVPRHFQRDMVDEIQEASQRLNRLVGNLLNMTRVETGHVKPKLDWCDVEDLVQVTLDDIEHDLTRHRISVEVAPDLPVIRMDFVLMQQVLTNLLLNAAAHTPPGTSVHLTAAMEGEELVLKVADNGPGLPAEALQQIFEKFYRAPAAPAGGTGLGLAIVKGFVEAQGGQVGAQNRPEGGSVFTVRLPSPGRLRRQSEPDYERLSRA
jgi:two-component system sensor histidine kinase KdpD